MALVANDLNVFDLPHNHMKRLVGKIEKQVKIVFICVSVRVRVTVCVVRVYIISSPDPKLC